ncbi:MAG: ABC transporter ATP-binding protein [Clostridia bacterium]|nr:ABC transporter ATP-binding protein [Clostridia bacterium]
MIKKLLKCVREYKIYAILTPLLVAGEAAMDVLIPYIMSKLIDNGIEKGDMAYTWKIGILLAFVCIVALAFGMFSGITAAKASTGFASNLRHDMYYRIQNYSFSNIDKFSPASIVTRLTTDVNNVQNAFQMITRVAVRAPLMLIFAVSMAFSINAKLSLVFVAVIPILGGGLFLIIKKAHPIFEKVFKLYDKLNNVVAENLHGIRVVKSFVREERENKKFNDVSSDIYKNFSKAEKILAFNSPLMQFSMYFCIILISWFAAHFIVQSGNNPDNGMTTGLLMTLISYASQILMSLMMLSFVFVMITISRASAGRIVEVLDEESDIVSPENAVNEVKDGSIVFENVDFSYAKDKNKLCLEGVNLYIKAGETVGIIGGTGSSKTTLVHLIPRLYDATNGSVRVGGRDVREYDIKSLRDEVAVVLQKNVLFSGTIKENLRWGKEDATDEEIKHACVLACADEFVETFPDKYDTHIEQGGANVSGGQKQRLCIARALLKKPKILILDDSTSAVDTATDAKIRKAFREEIPNTTKIIIAQRISSVQEADKIIVLDDGKVNDVGNHKELLERNSIYREVYTSQQKGAME